MVARKGIPEVIAHLEAENAFTTAATAHSSASRESLRRDPRAHARDRSLGSARRGAWWYYGRTIEGKQYGLQCRAPIAAEDDWTPPALTPGVDVPGEQVLFDANIEAGDAEFFSLGSFDVTDDGTRLLYAVDVAGDERYTLRVRDIASESIFLT